MNDDEAWREFLSKDTSREWAERRSDLWRENPKEPIYRTRYKIPDVPDGAVIIALGYDEIAESVDWANRRNEYNKDKEVQEKQGAVSHSVEWHVYGQLGQRALAKYLGIPWVQARKPIGDFRADGIGKISIRTRSKLHYALIVPTQHPKFDPSRAYVLGCAHAFDPYDLKPADFLLRGFLFGREAEARGRWFEPRHGGGATFVEQNKLRPMRELPDPYEETWR
jgi:hypothetical protein